MIHKTIQFFGFTAFVIRIGFDRNSVELRTKVKLEDGSSVLVRTFPHRDWDGYDVFQPSLEIGVGRLPLYFNYKYNLEEAQLAHRELVNKVQRCSTVEEVQQLDPDERWYP